MLIKKEWKEELLKSLWQKRITSFFLSQRYAQIYFHVSISHIGPIPMMPSYGYSSSST